MSAMSRKAANTLSARQSRMQLPEESAAMAAMPSKAAKYPVVRKLLRLTIKSLAAFHGDSKRKP
jgi:hypothetical protein